MTTLRTLIDCVKGNCFKYVARIFVALAVMTMLAVVIAIGCERRILFVNSITYGGRQYNSYISCGSSAGNFDYTCAEGGSCYENQNLTEMANDFCACSDEVIPEENSR